MPKCASEHIYVHSGKVFYILLPARLVLCIDIVESVHKPADIILDCMAKFSCIDFSFSHFLFPLF